MYGCRSDSESVPQFLHGSEVVCEYAWKGSHCGTRSINQCLNLHSNFNARIMSTLQHTLHEVHMIMMREEPQMIKGCDNQRIATMTAMPGEERSSKVTYRSRVNSV